MQSRLSPEIAKFVLGCWYGRFWHIEKIEAETAKKFNELASYEDIEAFIAEVDKFIGETGGFLG